MKSLTFIFISLFSGVLAGIVLAGVNLFVVEPYIDKAISIEVDSSTAQGEEVDFDELNSYRTWQKSGTFAAGAFLGITYGAILGVVYALSRKFLPSSDDRKKAIFLAGIMLLSLYVVPFIKYPANPPAVGDPETIGLRENLYIGLQIVSGLSVLGFGILFYLLRKVRNISYIIPAAYVGLTAVILAVFPSNPDGISVPMDLVNIFRVTSFSTMAIFWLSLGLIFGFLWNKFKPHEPTKVTVI